ncbi:MAG: asparagine synthase (glutamine-hydrolyzing) [Rubrivivax sp.]|nr:asparagine synthase (glutamine-hydrolyzing) [Rubrivivax sp.]
MCGIAGIHYKHDIDPGVLDRAQALFASRMHHRGPDDFGCHRTARAVYANRRLAIVDRAGGHQPIYEAGGARGIVYNGEVYNHEGLREALSGRWVFTTHSDTEAVLATVLHAGDEGLARLNGMFGLCVWDDRDASFLLARDRFGAKPLYVYEDAHCIAFASELRTLLGLEGLDHALDPVGFQDYLSYRYNLAPHTLFARIRKLPAGHVLRFAGGAGTITRYAEVTLHEPAAARLEADYVAELDALMSGAVRSQLMGEVPIGVLLSGGLDSSAIAAYVHKAGARLKAYSIGFPEVNEFVFSRDVARQFELDYVEVMLTQAELRAGMDTVIGQLDEPIADPACFALSRLCQRIREDVTVVLSGEGGDEMFAGYGHHTLALEPGLSRDAVFAHFFHQSANNLDANTFLVDKGLPPQHLRLRTHFDRADTALNGMQAFELASWMPENLMMKADKVLMAHSLEGRFPFLDLDIWRFAAQLPQAMKLPHAGSSKHVLRRLMAPQLPRSVIERRKMGFTVPPAFFLQTLQGRLRDAIDSLRGTPVAGVLDLAAIAALLQRFYGGEAMPVFKVWNLAVLLLWWADVYPQVKAAPAVLQRAPASGASRRKLVVYTALVGAKEPLANPLDALPADATTDLDIDFVCLTDNPALSSPVWRFMPIGQRHLPPEKLSRRPKALPHEYFPEAEFSLYVDNTVRFKRLPQAADLHTQRPYLLRMFRHGARTDPQQEAGAVVMLGYEDVDVVCRQMDFYAAQGPLSEIGPLSTCTVILRSHHHPVVKRFGQTWWESLLAFSKRDQLSVDYALREAGAEVEPFAGATHDNDWLDWHGSLSSRRVKASFDGKRYAWLHRDDPAAQADPRAHFLSTRSSESDDAAYLRTPALLEFLCHQQHSSLGQQVSPRRGVAPALQGLLAPWRAAGRRFLLACAQGGTGEFAFTGAEHDAAAQALSIYLHPAAGTRLDLQPTDLRDDGRVWNTVQQPFDVLVLLGVGAAQLPVALEKLHRLLSRERGALAVVFADPPTLQHAAELERWLAAQFSVHAQASLQAGWHDGRREPLPNAVMGIAWERVPVPAAAPAGGSAAEVPA